MSADGSSLRLWRARRRHHRIDAKLAHAGSGWELRFFWNDRLLMARRYGRQGSARSDAAARLRELERAGWVSHW